VQHFTPAEIRYIEDCYEDFIKELRNKFDDERLTRIEKAFRFANAAHEGIRRKSGEPYIIHPIAVAKIVAKDIGLGRYLNCCSYFARCCGRYRIPTSDIETMFGEKLLKLWTD
jgi:GTP diphosphokinase / guanosine-3',5'-bis(diphosphate) 3'-diphosphatase